MDFPLRPPEQVMRLARMGSFFATRLSFMQRLIRRMSGERWQIEPAYFKLDDEGHGRGGFVTNLIGSRTTCGSSKPDPENL